MNSANRFRFRAWDKRRKEMYMLPASLSPEEAIALFAARYGQRVPRDVWLEDGYEVGSEDPAFDCTRLKSNLTFERAQKAGMILMQSTGLCDKNGKEIFEGDALRDERGCCGTVWRRDSGEYTAKAHGYMHGAPIDSFNTKVEVIGNIYENPEGERA